MWNEVHSICLFSNIYLVLYSYLSLENWRPGSSLELLDQHVLYLNMAAQGASVPSLLFTHLLFPVQLHPAPCRLTCAHSACTSWLKFPSSSSTFLRSSLQTAAPWPSFRPKDIKHWHHSLPLEETYAYSASGLRAIGIGNSRDMDMKNIV